MDFINSTRMIADYCMARNPDGRELLVIVAKGTFSIPKERGATVGLHHEQVELVMSDVFYGEPGLSAPKYEVDFAPHKPRCDVLLNATAYAPQGTRVQRLIAGVQIGSWRKSIAVVGDRFWYRAAGVHATEPVLFSSMPITYDRAFGGVDQRHADPAKHAVFAPNPSGRGFHQDLRNEWLQNSPLPNTEELDRPVTLPNGNYRPMSFGSIGRQWSERIRFAGTYDQHWLDRVFPFLPADFDEQYYQAAPEDQQLQIPLGQQTVTLLNLTPDGRRDFVLPHFEAPIHVFPKQGEREDLLANLDTIMIEPDLERFTMTWRVARPLKRSIHEIAQVMVGRKGRDWWQERETIPFPLPVVVEQFTRKKNVTEPA